MALHGLPLRPLTSDRFSLIAARWSPLFARTGGPWEIGSHAGMGFTLWESQDALEASEQWADQLRDQSAEDTGSQVASVERFEVAIHELT